jgi:hypothetical protein
VSFDYIPPYDARALRALSQWVDENDHRDPEAVTWGRLAKVSEECGEVIEAFIGATGQNPRKGVTKTIDDVVKELLDVAVTALAAAEHMTGNDARSMGLFSDHLRWLIERAGIDVPSGVCPNCGAVIASDPGSRVGGERVTCARPDPDKPITRPLDPISDNGSRDGR